MNNDIEREFVNTFVIKNMRERLLFELSGKKRNKSLSRFAHSFADILDPKYTFRVNAKEEVLNEIARNDDVHSGKAYVISDIYDGIEMEAQEAIDFAFEEDGVVIVIFKGGIAFVKSELEQGLADKYLLKMSH